MNQGDPTLASDAERSSVVERLQQAHIEGRLSSDEVADRIEAALRARTRGDLAALLNDLPSDPAQAPVVPVPQPALPARRAGSSLAAAWASWGVASSVTFAIWLIIYITTGGAAWYPWFLWVAGPWGAVLLARTIASRFTDEP
jgi:hypothetical protein